MFEFDFKKTTYDCNIKSPHVIKAFQKRLMNTDTTHLIKGNNISDFWEEIEGSISSYGADIQSVFKCKYR